MKKFNAFTLAEILITILIIGIVAALTIPNLIYSYKKRVIETRLVNFYSMINQAISLSEIENGNKMFWDAHDTNDFWNMYLKKYLKYTETEDIFILRPRKIIYFNDGSALLLDIYRNYKDENYEEIDWQSNGGHFIYCPTAKDCKVKNLETLESISGIKAFTFAFWPNDPVLNDIDDKYHYNKGVEPYKLWWNGDKEELYEDCKNHGHYCCAIIQLNNWKIPDDYPLKI